MNTTFMNSKNSTTSNPLLLNLTNKIDLRRKDKYIPLSNLSIYYTWKNIKKLNKNNKLKISAPIWMKNLNYLMVHILYQILEIILIHIKKAWAKGSQSFNKNIHQ